MNLLIFLNLAYNPGKKFKFFSLQGQNFKILLIFTYNQGKVFLILPITRGRGKRIPGLHWELTPNPLGTNIDIILLFLTKPLDKHGDTLVHITYPPLDTFTPQKSSNSALAKRPREIQFCFLLKTY